MSESIRLDAFEWRDLASAEHHLFPAVPTPPALPELARRLDAVRPELPQRPVLAFGAGIADFKPAEAPIA